MLKNLKKYPIFFAMKKNFLFFQFFYRIRTSKKKKSEHNTNFSENYPNQKN